MGFFNRDKGSGTGSDQGSAGAEGWAQSLSHVARYAETSEEFLALYKPSDAVVDDPRGDSLLSYVVTHKVPQLRVELAQRLLDDGADAAATRADGLTVLHLLFDQQAHDPALEAPLVRRLLDGGADVNALSPRGDTALQLLTAQFHLSDDELAPLYDEVFARDELDLLQRTGRSDSVLAAVRKQAALRPDLVARAEAFLRDHGQPVPGA